MSQFLIKYFRKNQAVKLFIVESDKRIKVRYVIPKENNLTYNDKTWAIVENKMFYSEGFPSFVVSYKSAEPIDPNNLNKIEMSSKDYNTAISAQVAKEIFKVTDNKPDLALIGVALSAFTLIGLVILYMALSDLINSINPTGNLSTTTTTTIQTLIRGL